MSKRTKLLDSPWSKFSPSSASNSFPVSPSLDSSSSSSFVSDFSVDQTLSNNKAMEVISNHIPDYGDERFLGLPFEIWMQIFRYAGIICPCPIDLVTVNHRPAGSCAGKRGCGNSSHATMRAIKTDIVTCALRRSSFPTPCAHNSFLSMLAVSSHARQFTRRAIFQESLLVFTLRTTEDLMGFKQTLRGFARMAPLEHSLKRIQVVLKSHDGRRLKATVKKMSAINHYKAFCDYVGDKLRGTLKDYVFQCHVGDETVASELVDKMRNNFHMLNSCSFLFEYIGPGSIFNIARDAAVKTITHEEHAAQPFRFMDLPNEMKEMILKREETGTFLCREPVSTGGPCLGINRDAARTAQLISPEVALVSLGSRIQPPVLALLHQSRHSCRPRLPCFDLIVDFVSKNFDLTHITLDIEPKSLSKKHLCAEMVNEAIGQLKGIMANAKENLAPP